MITKEDIYKRLIIKRREKIDDFDTKVLTSILLKKFFEDKEYDFFFTPKLKKSENGVIKTPDYLAKKEGEKEIIGEIKQSLPDPEEKYFEDFLEKTIKQLKDYIGELEEISKPHDTFITTNQRYSSAISKLIGKIQENSDLRDKVIILKYLWNSGSSHRSLILQKSYGTFSDANIEIELKNGKDYMIGENDLNKSQGTYKIFYTEEQFNCPIEYVMAVLWFNVFPELAESSSRDRVIERIKQGSNTLNFSIEEIFQVLKKYYVLPSFPSEKLEQFSKKMILHSMEAFVSLKKAKMIKNESKNPTYSITLSKFSTRGELIEYFIEALNGEKFKKEAEIEYNKITNKSLV